MQNINQRDKLIERFIYWNSQINLSAIRNSEDIYKKHILDSLQLNNCFKFDKNKTCIDVGTGGGFPLLPISITNPETKFVGIDSTQKKVNAVQDMINYLKINNAKTIWGRSEQQKTQYDYIMARSVSYIDKLWKNVSNLGKPGAIYIFYKMYSDEHEDILKICKKNNLQIIKQHKYNLDGDDIQRIIYIIKSN